jgi:alpha-tubulin suppressor-like RCC1 family protein
MAKAYHQFITMNKITTLLLVFVLTFSSVGNNLRAQESYLWTMGITIGSYYNVANYYGINYLNPWPYTREYPVPIILEADEWMAMTAGGGNSHSGGIKADGTLWIWVGNGSPERAPEPLQLGTDNDWRAISFTNNGRYALKENGTLWNLMNSTQIGTDTDWETISSGNERTVALKTDGSVWNWTNNSAGTFENNVAQFASDSQWQFISCGPNGVAGIKADGTLWRFPNNINNAPTQEGTANDWSYADGGPQKMFALKNDGTIWVRGNSNNLGDLGLGHNDAVYELTQMGTDTDWVKIEVGSGHVYALKQDGSLYGWGNNNYRQLGDGTSVNKNAPVQIGEDGEWHDMAAGVNHGVALRSYGYGGSGGGVSINEVNKSSALTVFPNPAKHNITIQSKEQLKNVSLYNSMGELIWTTRDQRIDISSLAQGVYTLRIEAGNEIFMERLVVQK